MLGAAQASAETQPRSIGADPRIKQYTYVKDTVYRLDVAMKIITSIEFAPGEAIDSVLMGDSESWQVIRLQSGNVLAVKPLIAGARTNMTVYTSQNTYTFELRAVPIAAGSSSLDDRGDDGQELGGENVWSHGGTILRGCRPREWLEESVQPSQAPQCRRGAQNAPAKKAGCSSSEILAPGRNRRTGGRSWL